MIRQIENTQYTDLEFQMWLDSLNIEQKEKLFKRIVSGFDETLVAELITEHVQELHERGRICKKGLNRFLNLIAQF